MARASSCTSSTVAGRSLSSDTPSSICPGRSDALALGATLGAASPRKNVRVLIDPAGHPFCLCLDED
ncbi:VOC family protein [Catellatospora methionotrophica]|uniref:VOC family protein n=1 Tax=Catellatospora methionotrophica TaxID=121620 RepID=UPI0033D179CA